MARPKDHAPTPGWLQPFAPGKQFVIPNTPLEYRKMDCIDPVHIFLRDGANCKCKQFFWPSTDQYQTSRVIHVPRNDPKPSR